MCVALSFSDIPSVPSDAEDPTTLPDEAEVIDLAELELLKSLEPSDSDPEQAQPPSGTCRRIFVDSEGRFYIH